MFCAAWLLTVGWLLYVIFPSALTDLYRLFAKELVVNKQPNKAKAIVAAKFEFKLTGLFTVVPKLIIVAEIKCSRPLN